MPAPRGLGNLRRTLAHAPIALLVEMGRGGVSTGNASYNSRRVGATNGGIAGCRLCVVARRRSCALQGLRPRGRNRKLTQWRSPCQRTWMRPRSRQPARWCSPALEGRLPGRRKRKLAQWRLPRQPKWMPPRPLPRPALGQSNCGTWAGHATAPRMRSGRLECGAGGRGVQPGACLGLCR